MPFPDYAYSEYTIEKVNVRAGDTFHFKDKSGKRHLYIVLKVTQHINKTFNTDNIAICVNVTSSCSDLFISTTDIIQLRFTPSLFL